MIVIRTPLRISLGGGGTDLPFYADKFGASLITAAINKYVYITISPTIQKDIKLNYSQTEHAEHVTKVKHPLIREALIHTNNLTNIEIHSSSDVLSGTGLGSSSSFLVGLLNGLNYYNGNRVSKYKLAEDSSHIIMDVLKEPAGKQDQYAAAFGGLSHLRINTNGKVIVTPINISQENVDMLEKNLMLFYTGFTRSANDILGEQKKKAEQNETEIFNYYHEIKKIGEASLKCLEKGDLRRFGEWMNIHWELKRKITNNMSNSKIDEWYALALANGAIGGKVIGAGGGGFLLFYVEKNHDKVKQILETDGLVHIPFKFEFEGSRIVYDGKHF